MPPARGAANGGSVDRSLRYTGAMHHREPPSPELQQILAAAWAALAQGAEDPRDDLHWPVLASVTAPACEPLAGNAAASHAAGLSASHPGGPDARTVVLRACDPAERRLEVHSDIHTGKIAQLRALPRVCLVGHRRDARTQLRLWGEASIHHRDALTASAWQRLAPHSRANYRSAEDFALIRVLVDRLDWLLVDPGGHRRAAFDWRSGRLDAHWLQA
jgi:pyridoxamine 5'-phosphate oxidase